MGLFFVACMIVAAGAALRREGAVPAALNAAMDVVATHPAPPPRPGSGAPPLVPHLRSHANREVPGRLVTVDGAWCLAPGGGAIRSLVAPRATHGHIELYLRPLGRSFAHTVLAVDVVAQTTYALVAPLVGGRRGDVQWHETPCRYPHATFAVRVAPTASHMTLHALNAAGGNTRTLAALPLLCMSDHIALPPAHHMHHQVILHAPHPSKPPVRVGMSVVAHEGAALRLGEQYLAADPAAVSVTPALSQAGRVSLAPASSDVPGMHLVLHSASAGAHCLVREGSGVLRWAKHGPTPPAGAVRVSATLFERPAGAAAGAASADAQGYHMALVVHREGSSQPLTEIGAEAAFERGEEPAVLACPPGPGVGLWQPGHVIPQGDAAITPPPYWTLLTPRANAMWVSLL